MGLLGAELQGVSRRTRLILRDRSWRFRARVCECVCLAESTSVKWASAEIVYTGGEYDDESSEDRGQDYGCDDSRSSYTEAEGRLAGCADDVERRGGLVFVLCRGISRSE